MEAEVEVGKLLKQADDAANSGEEDAKQEAEDLKSRRTSSKDPS